MTSDQLTSVLEAYLADARGAAVIEDGSVLFDLASAKYSISGSSGNGVVNGDALRGKTLLHLWSDERNLIRRVVDAEEKGGVLRLTVLKFGQSRPSKMEICRDRDRRSPSAKKSVRARYEAKLKRILQWEYPGWHVDRITTDMDLERSFGPIYTRALLRHGQSAFAVLGVNAQEPQTAIDAALTIGVLWLDYCRERYAERCYVAGLKLYVPAGHGAVVRERMAHLDRDAAKWELYALDESAELVEELDATDRGNIETHLVQRPDPVAAHARFANSIARVTTLVPEAETVILSAGEVSFRLRGLEFAHARIGAVPGSFSFRNVETITFGTGANETELTEETEEKFTQLMRRARALRSPYAKPNPLWRMVPERWLESIILRDVSELDDRLDRNFVYSQVPAFTAADRGMMDILTCTREGRLVILELKADEDIHLPLQGVDYWARVVWHQSRDEFHRHGYFAGREISPLPPLLLLVAPALRVHPTTDTLLRYIAPEIPCTVLGIDEHWRAGVRVVFRKKR